MYSAVIILRAQQRHRWLDMELGFTPERLLWLWSDVAQSPEPLHVKSGRLKVGVVWLLRLTSSHKPQRVGRRQSNSSKGTVQVRVRVGQCNGGGDGKGSL